MMRRTRSFLAAVVAGVASFVSLADTTLDPVVDRLAPDFIRTSLVVCGPGTSLYACAGHAALRLTCSHYGLDEVFSYESEPVEDQYLRFFAGELKMGLFAIPWAEFKADYQEGGRSVVEYPLALPPAAEVRLWEILDKRVAQGPNLPYDYVKRGCAQAMLRCLLEALASEPVEAAPPKRLGQTRRDVIHAALGADHPWTVLLLDLVAGPAGDRMKVATDVIQLPSDLVDYLRGVRVAGVAVLEGDPIRHAPQAAEAKGIGAVVTPNVCAFALLALAVLGCCRGRRALHGALLALHFAFAVFMTYVGVFSSLPVAAGNVLLVPFNPLPFVFWRWRTRWCRAYAAVLIGWSLAMFLAPHHLTSPAFVIFALALAVVWWPRRQRV